MSAASPPLTRRPARGHPLETFTLVHVGVLLLAGTWIFGGGSEWGRQLLSVWGSLGVIVTVLATRSRVHRHAGALQPLHWLWPCAAFNVLALASCLNPSFSEQIFAGQSFVAHTGAAYPWLPSTVFPPDTLRHLWLFDATYLSCFNLLLVVQRRHALRGLLLVACANAVLLSVFGTFQRLTSTGLFFGLVPSPNPRFFATFIYGNHWAAFIVLMIAACAGLIFCYLGRHDTHPWSGSPLPMGLSSLMLMGITPVIDGSRAGTILVMLLLAGCVVQAALRLRRRRQTHDQSEVWPLAGLALCAILTAGAALYLGRASLRERWTDTQGQWQSGLVQERLKLYGDTWQLAMAQPVFGWGLGCYDKALLLLRPRPLEARRQYEHSYVDAHSDWLQSLAEAGLAGTLLVVLCGFLPLRSVRWRHLTDPLPGYLLAGCGLILLYAGVEFPFGNPAVVIAFWTCFFCAIRYNRLEELQSGAEPAPPAAPAP